MRYLLLIAHGSRREQSNNEIKSMVQRLAVHPNNAFDVTRHAFLEMATPSIPQVIDACVKEGASDITVLPYFLSAGNHVVRDIPALIDNKRCEYPQLNLEVVAHFGLSASLVEGVLAHVNRDAD